MPKYICRACGTESRVWKPGGRCEHCNASDLYRLTPERVAAELEAMALLHGNGEMPPGGFPPQLDLFEKGS